MNRTTYNKLHYEYQRKQREMLETFKREHPERYAELMKKVQTDIEEEEKHPYLRLQTTSTLIPHVSEQQLTENTNRLNRILERVRAGRKDYYIDIEIPHNGWVETHKYFELLNKPEDALSIVSKKYELVGAKVTRTEMCSCPLCQ